MFKANRATGVPNFGSSGSCDGEPADCQRTAELEEMLNPERSAATVVRTTSDYSVVKNAPFVSVVRYPDEKYNLSITNNSCADKSAEWINGSI